MKKTLLVLFVFIGLNLGAQETLTEGVLISKQTMFSDNEQVNNQLQAMGTTTSTTYFKGDKSRNETNSAMTGEMTIVMDGATKQMLMLMNQPMLGKKYALQSAEPSEEDLKNITVTTGTETRNILGYNCKQYIVKLEQNGQQMEMQMFTTDKISALSQNTTAMGEKVEGFPLYFVIKMSQMGSNIEVITEVTEIKKEQVSDDKFSLTPPEGYEKMEGM